MPTITNFGTEDCTVKLSLLELQEEIWVIKAGSIHIGKPTKDISILGGDITVSSELKNSKICSAHVIIVRGAKLTDCTIENCTIDDEDVEDIWFNTFEGCNFKNCELRSSYLGYKYQWEVKYNQNPEWVTQVTYIDTAYWVSHAGITEFKYK